MGKIMRIWNVHDFVKIDVSSQVRIGRFSRVDRGWAIMFVVLALIFMLVPAAPIHAAGSASFSLRASTSQVRIGDTVTITGAVSTSATIATFDLSVLYNASQLQYVRAEGISPVIRSGELDVNPGSGKVQLLYLDADGGSTGINGGSAFRVIFKVSGGNTGDRIDLGLQLRTVGDGSAGAMSANGSGVQLTLAAPLSGNADLASMTVDSGQLLPAFSSTRTSYTLAVPFSIERLKVNASAEDSAAKVSIDSPALAAGGSTQVSVTVIAASGARKTYTISVTRARDPNYVPSANNVLSNLFVDGFSLSPAFTKTRTEYIIYLPNEIVQLTVTGKPEDPRASVNITGNTNLQVEKANEINITCKAENGSLQTYTIFALRAAPFAGRAMLNTLLPGAVPGTGAVVTVTPSMTPTPGATTGMTQITRPTEVRATETTSVMTGVDVQGGSESQTGAVDSDSGGVGLVVWILLAVFVIVALGEGIYIWRGRRR